MSQGYITLIGQSVRLFSHNQQRKCRAQFTPVSIVNSTSTDILIEYKIKRTATSNVSKKVFINYYSWLVTINGDALIRVLSLKDESDFIIIGFRSKLCRQF